MQSSSSGNGGGGHRRGRPPSRHGVTKSRFCHKRERSRGRERLAQSQDRAAAFDIRKYADLRQLNQEGYISAVCVSIEGFPRNPPIWPPYEMEITVSLREINGQTFSCVISHNVICDILEIEPQFAREQCQNFQTWDHFYNPVRGRGNEISDALLNRYLIYQNCPTAASLLANSFIS